MARPPKDHVPLNLPTPPKPTLTGEAVERETHRDPDAKSALEGIGRRFEGLDGKRYVASIAVHVYEIPRLVGNEYVFYSQSSDLSRLDETIARESIKELTRAIMVRYGRKPPRKTTDKAVEREDGR